MKILLIVDDYLPHSIKVAAKMMHELALEFKNQGHSVYVITPAFNIKSKFNELNIDGVTVFQFSSGEIKNVSKVKRAINETLLSFRAWNALKPIVYNLNCELIVYYSPSIFWGSLVKKLKKIWNARTYLILRDFFPQWAIDNRILKKNSPITKYFQFFEKKNYEAADSIGLMSPGNLNWFQKYYYGNSKLKILFNWASDKPIILNAFPYRKKFGLETKVVFFYGGNIGHAQDMGQILRLAKKLQSNQDVAFVLVGAGDEEFLVRDTISKENLTNILLLSPVSQEEFKRMLAEFDIGLFCLNRNHTTHNFPGKILGYLVQCLPILGSVNPGNDLKQIIEETNAGIVVEAGDDNALYEAAIKLLDKNFRHELAKNGKYLLSQKFSIRAACENIISS
ncbi:glycosyltransferase family 4 protein [Leptospira sp. 96542]|nr:glycosyltransferase family 4 protein [Leptospira sp. 96542]